MKKNTIQINISTLALAIGLFVLGLLYERTWKDTENERMQHDAMQGCVETNWNEYTDTKAGSLVRVVNEAGVQKCMKLRGY